MFYTQVWISCISKQKKKIKIITQVSNYMYMYHNFSTHIVILLKLCNNLYKYSTFIKMYCLKQVFLNTESICSFVFNNMDIIGTQ